MGSAMWRGQREDAAPAPEHLYSSRQGRAGQDIWATTEDVLVCKNEGREWGEPNTDGSGEEETNTRQVSAVPNTS